MQVNEGDMKMSVSRVISLAFHGFLCFSCVHLFWRSFVDFACVISSL